MRCFPILPTSPPKKSLEQPHTREQLLRTLMDYRGPQLAQMDLLLRCRESVVNLVTRDGKKYKKSERKELAFDAKCYARRFDALP